MDSISAGDSAPVNGAYIETGGLGRFIPEPASRAGEAFRSVLSGVASMAGRAMSALPSAEGDYGQLLALQIQMQQEMQRVSMESNIEKSRHETQMAAIRNIRVG